MADLRVSDPEDTLTIESHRGPYSVLFAPAAREMLAGDLASGAHFLIDAKIAELYPEICRPLIESGRTLLITATERNKDLDRIPELARELLQKGIRRDTTLVAVGGGITQDIACFLASILMRGIQWKFYPTTLLAQADSCIGSKSSINVAGVKNSAGTFWPPESVVIDRTFLGTLSDSELRSGVGEMIKVHIIDGPRSFDALAAHYHGLFRDPAILQRAVRRSLEIKKRIIEADEFDTGPRQILNYGHTFGHAIESATNYGIPHGIAITIGMDMANYVAVGVGELAQKDRARMKAITDFNARGFEKVAVELDAFESAIKGDKKVSGADVTVILPNRDSIPVRLRMPLDDRFFGLCRSYLMEERGRESFAR
jgi:3-dehydroquinate synthase